MARALVLLAVLATLAGCGGGHHAAAPPSPTTPPTTRTTLTAWHWRADPADAGLHAGWPRHGVPRTTAVAVPFVPDAGAIAGRAGTTAYQGSVGWLERTVDLPAAGRWRLRFGSANHRATVWIDGRRAGGHVGAYEPFAVTRRLAAGRHRVTVRLDWRDPARQAAEGWARGWFNWGGLARPVTLERVGRTELGALRVATHLRADGSAAVTLGLRVGNDARAARRIAARATLAHGDRTLAIAFPARRVPAHGAVLLRRTVVVERPALWSPAHPDRWRLRARAAGATLRARVGLRELRWTGGRLRLNGRPLVLRGAAVPPDARGRGDALRPQDEARIVAGLRALHANATRAQMPLSASLLDRLDAAGILVWQEAGPWDPAGRFGAATPALRRAATTRALRQVALQQWHPSIVAWSLANELIGDEHHAGQIAWIATTAARVRALDPTRPVAADLWGRHLPRAAGVLAGALDAVGVTDYVGWYEGLGAPPAQQDALVRARLASLRRLFPHAPLVVTEFGAAGTATRPAGAPGGEGFQAALLARRIALYRGIAGLDGMLVWSLRDFALRPDFRGGSIVRTGAVPPLTAGLNEKGLFTYAGRPKPAARTIARAFAP